MIATSFKDQNLIIQGGEDFYDLPAHSTGASYITCWKLNREELDEIQRSGCVYLQVYTHGFHPPVHLQVSDPFRVPRQLLYQADPEVWAERILVTYYDDDEVVCLRLPDPHRGYGLRDAEQRSTLYLLDSEEDLVAFQEELFVKDLARCDATYDNLCALLGWKKEEVLVLGRVEKTA